jgi:hypothetical protein
MSMRAMEVLVGDWAIEVAHLLLDEKGATDLAETNTLGKKGRNGIRLNGFGTRQKGGRVRKVLEYMTAGRDDQQHLLASFDAEASKPHSVIASGRSRGEGPDTRAPVKERRAALLACSQPGPSASSRPASPPSCGPALAATSAGAAQGIADVIKGGAPPISQQLINRVFMMMSAPYKIHLHDCRVPH